MQMINITKLHEGVNDLDSNNKTSEIESETNRLKVNLINLLQ